MKHTSLNISYLFFMKKVLPLKVYLSVAKVQSLNLKLYFEIFIESNTFPYLNYLTYTYNWI